MLTHKLGTGLKLIEDSDAGVEEIGRGLGEVVALLQALPEWLRDEVKEYIPQFHINQQGPTWIEPLVQHWLGNMSKNEHSYNPTPSPKDDAGRFLDATTKEN